MPGIFSPRCPAPAPPSYWPSRERAQASSHGTAQGVCPPPLAGTPTTRCPLTHHRPSDADTGPGGWAGSTSDAGPGNTLPFPGLTRHWIRTEDVVCGVTETKLGGSPGTAIQERRKRGLAGSACTWPPFWSQLPPGSDREAGQGPVRGVGRPASQHPCFPPFPVDGCPFLPVETVPVQTEGTRS